MDAEELPMHALLGVAGTGLILSKPTWLATANEDRRNGAFVAQCSARFPGYYEQVVHDLAAMGLIDARMFQIHLRL